MTRRFEELTAIARKDDSASLSREECLEATRAFSEERRAAIRRRHAEGESGSNVVRMISETADEILRGVFQFGMAVLCIPRAVTSRICLCALGDMAGPR